MDPNEKEFDKHQQDLKGTGNPDANSDLKRDEGVDPHGNLAGERTADGTLSERASELSGTEYVERLDQEKKPGNDGDEQTGE